MSDSVFDDTRVMQFPDLKLGGGSLVHRRVQEEIARLDSTLAALEVKYRNERGNIHALFAERVRDITCTPESVHLNDGPLQNGLQFDAS